MEDRLARELQVAEAQDQEDEALDPGMAALAEVADETAALSPEVKALIDRCMAGTEPFPDGQRKYWESQKFSPRHVQVVLLRVAGFKNNDISSMLQMDKARVCVTLRHPYAKKIISAIIPHQATRVIDIRTRMEEQASELMDHAFGLAMRSEELKEVREVTFGFLDRAGYNVTNKNVNANLTPRDLRDAGPSALNRLASALEGSQLVDAAVMPNWTAPQPPDAGAAAPHSVVEGSEEIYDSVPAGGWVGPQAPVPESVAPRSGVQGQQSTDSTSDS